MNDFQKIIDFIRELYQQPEGFIPLHAPVFKGNEKKYLEDCIDSTFVSSVGKYVGEFENKVAEYTGANYAVACVNGTNALFLALKLAGVNAGDEVITQPLTFIATANAISYCGATPVFMDVDIDTMGLSPSAVLYFLENQTFKDSKTGQTINKLTNKPITACVPMHTFGHPCRVDELVEICSHYGIPVVEDAAESLGSFYKQKHTGTFGLIGVLSFNGNKIVTTGGGGMLLFNDEHLAKRARHLTTQAKVPHRWEFIHDEIGYNYRMPNINAALGLAQIEQLAKFLISKREIANEYQGFFTGSECQFFEEPPNAHSNFWLNAILLKDISQRNEFLKYSNDNGVNTRPAWKLMVQLPMYINSYKGPLVNVNRIYDRLVNIPSSVNR